MPATQGDRSTASHHSGATVQRDTSEEAPSAVRATQAPSSPSDSGETGDITATQDTAPGEGPAGHPSSAGSEAASDLSTQQEDRDQEGEEPQGDEEEDSDPREGTSTCPSQRAYVTVVARTHELMAEWTDILRRLTDLRIHQHGAPSELLPHPIPLLGSPVCERRQGAVAPPPPVLVTCSQPWEAAGPTPPVRVSHSQSREAAGPTPPVRVSHSQPREAAGTSPPVQVSHSQPREAAGPSPPVPPTKGKPGETGDQSPPAKRGQSTPPPSGTGAVGGVAAGELGLTSEGGGKDGVETESL
uniref:Uncharacterized protein n=1 Tax=Sphaerodactylus townsendi TaxID=933632 RepID=A0ACB8F0I0_9SAUR